MTDCVKHAEQMFSLHYLQLHKQASTCKPASAVPSSTFSTYKSHFANTDCITSNTKKPHYGPNSY